MKSWFTTAVVFLATAVCADGLPPKLRVVREGVALSVPEPDRVISLLTRLVEGSSVNSTSHVEVERAWTSGLAAPSFIHVRLGRTRDMRVVDSGNQVSRATPVHEILVVVPRNAWPGYLLLRTAAGLVAVTKYPPCDLAELMSESDLAVLDRKRGRFASEVLLKACRRESEQ